MAKFEIYKKGQGKYTRMCTFIGAMVLVVVGAKALSDKLNSGFTSMVPIRFGVPALLVILAGVTMLWLVNRVRTADFLIATEGEMKKVSWSSRKEVIGSTKVVIVFTFILTAVLYAADFIFILLFRKTGVMG